MLQRAEGGPLTVAYVVGQSPQPESTFTHDEIAVLSRQLAVVRAGAMAARPHDEWLAPSGFISRELLAATLRASARHPRALMRGIGSIMRASWRNPKALLVGIRGGLAGCVMAERSKVDVIHAQFAGPAAAAAFVWSRLTGIPYSIRMHAYDIYSPYPWIDPVLHGSGAVLAISEHGRQHIARAFGVKASVLRVGIPLAAIRKRPRDAPRDPFRILSVGALNEKKGHATAIEAIRELASRGRRVSLDIIGDGPLRAQLAAQIGASPVTLRGVMAGPDVRAAYADYDLFLMTSQQARSGDIDGIPVVLMEAMAAELPVLSTVVGGIAELVIDRETGTTTSNDPASIADGIDSLMRRYDECVAMTLAARRRIELDYNVHHQGRRLADTLEALVRAERGGRSTSLANMPGTR